LASPTKGGVMEPEVGNRKSRRICIRVNIFCNRQQRGIKESGWGMNMLFFRVDTQNGEEQTGTVWGKGGFDEVG